MIHLLRAAVMKKNEPNQSTNVYGFTTSFSFEPLRREGVPVQTIENSTDSILYTIGDADEGSFSFFIGMSNRLFEIPLVQQVLDTSRRDTFRNSIMKTRLR